LDDFDTMSDAAALVLVLAISVFAIIVVPVVADEPTYSGVLHISGCGCSLGT
jgi:hypothetical protein